jgi:hypothetical protein
MSRKVISALGGFAAIAAVVVIGTTVAWSNIVAPLGHAYTTKAEFERTFADMNAMPQALNTAPTREKLRNIGWKLLNASNASK